MTTEDTTAAAERGAYHELSKAGASPDKLAEMAHKIAGLYLLAGNQAEADAWMVEFYVHMGEFVGGDEEANV